MKKWFFLLIILFLVYVMFEQKLKVTEIYRSNQKAQEVSSQVKYQIRKITNDQVYQGNLVLINKEYPVHQEGVKSDVINLSEHEELVRGYELGETNIQLSQIVAQLFSKMVDDAEKDNVRHFSINSGYRGFEEQSQLFEQMGSDYALPAGYSEHNLGLSLDIGSTRMEMNQAPEGKWLTKNAWKYGFILRYPKDKSAITGIQYEPWHYRYIGLPHSAIMQKEHFVLEQYLDYVKKEKNLSFSFEGEEYDISYYPASQNATIKVPLNRDYVISGDNIDGVIVTVFP